MTNRRAFCRTVAGAAGALVLAPFHARAQEARRQVTIGGRRVKVIDIHCHCVIPEAAEVVKNTPLAKAGGGGGGNQVLGPQRSRSWTRRASTCRRSRSTASGV